MWKPGDRLLWFRQVRNGEAYDVPVVFVRYAGVSFAMVYKESDPTREERRVLLRVLRRVGEGQDGR